MSYKIVTTDTYLKKLKKFIKRHLDVLERYMKTIGILELNPNHPSLRLHKLQGRLCELHSVSITMEYRIIIDFILKDDEIIPVDIGIHGDMY